MHEYQRVILESAMLLPSGGSLHVPELGFSIFRWESGCWWILWMNPPTHRIPLGKDFSSDIEFKQFIGGNARAGKNMTREEYGYMGPIP